MSIYDLIEAEGKALFSDEYAKDKEFQDFVRSGREREAREREKDARFWKTLPLWALGTLVAIGLVTWVIECSRN